MSNHAPLVCTILKPYDGDWESLVAEKMMQIDDLDDAVLAAAFRRLARHLQHRSDAQNVDLMGLAGFCRNCLGDWVAEAADIDQAEGREAVYGMPYSEWKEKHQQPATPQQLERMEKSVAKNRK